MRKLLTVLFYTVLCYAMGISHAFSQPYLFEVQTLNVEQGLPDRMVGHIVQDHNGYIWVSSRGNISRYDGTEWKVYNYSQLNTLQQLKTYLAIDKQNRLWYAESRDGAYSAAIDINTDEIITLQTLSDGLLHSDSVVFVNNSRINENQILIATENGKVYTYDDDFELIYTVPNAAQNGFYVVVEEGNEADYFIFIHDFVTAEKEILHVKDKQLKNRFDIPDNFYYRLTRVFPNGMIELYSGGNYEYHQLQNDSLIRTIQTQKLYPPYRIIEWNENYECRYTQDNRVVVFDNINNLMYEKK